MRALKDVEAFNVDVRGNDIIVTLPKVNFKAVYYRPATRACLVLRHRSKNEDDTLYSKAWIAATVKARELGWII
jgi:hypothetical protein